MKKFKQFAITFLTLAITFVIPITLTRAIQENPEDIRTRAQEISASAAATVNTGFTALAETPEINMPLIGSVTIASLGLFLAAIIFLIITIIAGIKVFKSEKVF